MTDTVKLEWSDICRHEHRCEGASCNNWLSVFWPGLPSLIDGVDPALNS
mgnify:CR=1 FL=1